MVVVAAEITHFGTASAGPVHFGLGTNRLVDLVEIRWPSNIVQQLRNLLVDRVIRVKEPVE